MIYTHFYNFLLKLISTIVIIIGLVILDFDLDLPIFFIIFFLLWSVIYFGFLRTFGTYLYCKFTLKMNITFNDARKFNAALAPLFKQHWLPLKEIKQVPQNQKVQLAETLMKEWLKNEEENPIEAINKFKKFNMKSKILNIILAALGLGVIVVAFLNIPPASYITDAYLSALNTDEYYPFLNMVVLWIPLFVIAYIFKKLGFEV